MRARLIDFDSGDCGHGSWLLAFRLVKALNLWNRLNIATRQIAGEQSW